MPDQGGDDTQSDAASGSESDQAELAALWRLIGRERAARRQAEDLLESKSREIYVLNQSLEERVRERTAELDEANARLRQEAETRATAQRLLFENEERFRSVVNHVIDGIITIDGSGIIDFINPAAESLFGYPDGELRGQNVSVLMPASVAENHDEYLARYLRTGEAHIIGMGREVVAKRRDGTTFDLELSLSEYRQGPRTMFVGITRDMTERHRIASELKNALEGAESASRMKSEFLGKMSHELRTPMSAILGYAELLMARGISVQETAEFVERVRLNAAHLLDIINDLLDLTKIEALQVVIEQEPTSLPSLIDDVASLMVGKARQKSLDFRVEYLTPMPSRVSTDPLRFRQVVINLVSNAIKFTDSGAVVLSAASEQLAGDRVRFTLDVTDTGHGMPEESLEEIFEPFFQIRACGTADEGTGLGLAISRQIARLLDGEIEVTYELGTGTNFRFYIEADCDLAFSKHEAD